MPSWCCAAGASCRLGLLVSEVLAGLMAVLPVPVLVASLMCCCRCQLPAWSVAARASCRLGVVLPVPAAG
ncbi:hypothetical protein PF005_g26781 [Phytophthora fragariae]|uniref:Uncharacterized protein n=1 Tax=Phytophthora fragariae TaxID=53985 RepID=A0A6A4BKN2_9STRA|nr:hypothetical protein PF003_g31641 [Phytophthora fragariae]KAE8884302.1 hypothetical protein PF003_g31639 [Phytophthora fragariae]KAE8884306.1 hypothetical protein PF003_g31637 [Phytophthora fragariae]KAE9162415.1 hypothetical protein PF004_g30501 [Phytophthora fragariae]KAE9172273.1 hypothetical protein PF005_g26781 [Phytophthora fragariae]